MDFLCNELSEVTESSEVSLTPSFDGTNETERNFDEPVVSNDAKDKNTVYLITRNEDLEGDVHPITGIPFERMRIEYNGKIFEGVFPKFEAIFEVHIPEELYEETDYKQFKVCNEQLLKAIESNPELKAKFSEEQLEQIRDGVYDGSAPDGYVWHHSPEPGVIQLVDYDTHAKTGHTGGRAIWGGGSECR